MTFRDRAHELAASAVASRLPRPTEHDPNRPERVVTLATDASTWEVLDTVFGGEPVGRILDLHGSYRTEHLDCAGVSPGFFFSSFDDAVIYFEEYLFAVELGLSGAE